MAFHEGKACDAVVRVIEARESHCRRDVRSPEKDGDPAPIELTCRIGGRLFAFEHTGIEPFAGHVKFEAEAQRHFDPIRNLLNGRLPSSDVFELHLPVMATQGRRARELKQIQTALARWVEATAPSIVPVSYGSYAAGVQGVRPPGVPFDVSLHRFRPGGPLPGHFQIRHGFYNDLEEAREDRVREAYARKVPKLEVWRRDKGARTILILEENDLQLTNPQRVFDALVRVENAIADKPDEVHLVSTMIANPWYIHAMRIDMRNYYQLSD
jgi:hypothetical protein